MPWHCCGGGSWQLLATPGWMREMKEGAGCHLLRESVGLTHTPWLSRGSCSRSNSNLFPSKAQGQGGGSGSPFQPTLKITFLKSGRYVFSQPYTPRKTCFPQTKTKLPPLHQSSLNREINVPVIIMHTVLPPNSGRKSEKMDLHMEGV